MIQYTDDPNADFRAWDREQARWESVHVQCDNCGCTPSDHYYLIGGTVICEDCLPDFRVEVED